MLAAILQGITVAILATSGVEQTELEGPKKALEAEGALVQIVSPVEGKIEGWDCYNLKVRDQLPVDVNLKQAKAENFDALVIPGALFTDDLRLAENAIPFVKGFKDKPIGSICHGAQLLISADLVKGKTLTSCAAIEVDIVNAGGKWVDREVVRDGNLVTSRTPADIPAFNTALIALLKERSTKK